MSGPAKGAGGAARFVCEVDSRLCTRAERSTPCANVIPLEPRGWRPARSVARRRMNPAVPGTVTAIRARISAQTRAGLVDRSVADVAAFINDVVVWRSGVRHSHGGCPVSNVSWPDKDSMPCRIRLL